LLANLILATISSKDPCLHNKGDKTLHMYNFTVAVVNCQLQLQLQLAVASKVVHRREYTFISLLNILEAQRGYHNFKNLPVLHEAFKKQCMVLRETLTV
jgi:hypothetical protein